MAENLAKVVTRESIVKALEEIIKTNPTLIPSTKFDLVYNGRRFPPKEVVRIAAQIQGVKNWESYRLYGGDSSNKHLKEKGFDIQPKIAAVKYYIGGAKWEEDDYTDDFIENGYWQNGYNDRFLEEIKSVPVGSFIAIKSTYAKGKESILRIKCIGEVIENHGDGKTLKVNWEKPFKYFDISGLGSYRQTFHEITDPYDIDAIFNYDEPDDPTGPTTEHRNMSKPLNTILYGPPGTGKTYHTIDKALQIVDPQFYIANKKDRDKLTDRFKQLLIKDWSNPKGQIAFITFHQSLSYEDFIEGIKPEVIESGNDEGKEDIIYQVKDGLFKLIAQKASWRKGNFEKVIEAFKKEYNELENKPALTITSKYTTFDVAYRGTTVFYVRPHNSKKNNAWYPVSIVNLRKVYETDDYEGVYNPTYVREILEYLKQKRGLVKPSDHLSEKPEPHVLIIDEINRGNVAQIFGELITLIESDKRAGEKEELEIFLPYSKKPFSVPKNLYIIGTMNTADRSVEALDTALRRRFAFEEMMPDITTLEETEDGIDLPLMLKTMNDRLEVLLDRDHTIGHAWLIGCKNVDEVSDAFENKIIPLLKEFFYNEYSKIGLVIGKAFVEKEVKNQGNMFASFDLDTDIKKELAAKPVYRINMPEGNDLIKAFQAIYPQE